MVRVSFGRPIYSKPRRSIHLYKIGLYETYCFIATYEYDTYTHMDTKQMTFGSVTWSFI